MLMGGRSTPKKSVRSRATHLTFSVVQNQAGEGNGGAAPRSPGGPHQEEEEKRGALLRPEQRLHLRTGEAQSTSGPG